MVAAPQFDAETGVVVAGRCRRAVAIVGLQWIIWVITVSNIRAAGAFPVPIMVTTALASAIKESFRIPYIARDTQDTNLVQMMIQVDKPPTDLAFELSLRATNHTWPVGPVGWAAGKMGWWAYDLDLPATIQSVDVVLTPAALAVPQLEREDSFGRLAGVKQAWDGPALVISNLQLGLQRIELDEIKPPSPDVARAEALEELMGMDPMVRQLREDGNVARARAGWEHEVAQHPDNNLALFNLGCLAEADGDWLSAMGWFEASRKLTREENVLQKTQHQLRRICSECVYNIHYENDPAAMHALGRAYELGWGVGQAPGEAKHWYRDAANAGQVEAMYYLAGMYEHETGATVHTAQAHAWYRAETLAWYRQAADLGNQKAKQWLAAHPQF